jgi:hypothetical protein
MPWPTEQDALERLEHYQALVADAIAELTARTASPYGVSEAELDVLCRIIQVRYGMWIYWAEWMKRLREAAA